MAPTLRRSARRRTERLLLLETHRVNIHLVHRNLRAAVLGDYLEHRSPCKPLPAVVRSYRLAKHIQRLLPGNPRLFLLEALEEEGVRSFKEAAQAVLRHIEAGKRNQDVRRCVFMHLWYAIVAWLPAGRYRRQAAVNCNAVFGFADRANLYWEVADERDLKAEIAYELELEADDTDGRDFARLLNGSAFDGFWEQVKRFQNHPDHAKPVVKARITAFLDRRQRTRELRDMLESVIREVNWTPREESFLMSKFYRGMFFADPEQVLAMTFLYECLSYPFIGQWYWDCCWSMFGDYMERSVYIYRCGWFEAAVRLSRSESFVCWDGRPGPNFR
ncbi:hypothetical protein HDU96_005417 [Phlyctochytrium bullatum]|nr:hypothetical protein HDU96_005417 [Phlyctochytrium bullatum]